MPDDVDEVIAAVEVQIAKAEAFDAIAPALAELLALIRPWGLLPIPGRRLCVALTLELAKTPERPIARPAP